MSCADVYPFTFCLYLAVFEMRVESLASTCAVFIGAMVLLQILLHALLLRRTRVLEKKVNHSDEVNKELLEQVRMWKNRCQSIQEGSLDIMVETVQEKLRLCSLEDE